MSQREIIITDEEIAYTEKILFGRVDVFDDERKAFIQNLETIDLQAVPGSGKTTALLAKLLILERYLPFEDGSGVLVLSHTNAAIDEIKNTIGKYCPRLFAYPNFVGTIQTFTDSFLAIPYYVQKYGKKPWRIDDETYRDKTGAFASKCFQGFSQQDQNKAKYYLNLKKEIVSQYRFDIQNKKLVLVDSLNGKVLDFKKPKGRTKPENYRDFSSAEKSNIEKWLTIFKKNIMIDDGILHYDDAYFLAKCYLWRYPKINEYLQKRFRYIFVDEMQDMDYHQYNLLEQIFMNDSKCALCYQRIGDKNQAIFSGKVKLDDIWVDREKVLPITGSRRLSSTIASVVEPFGMPRIPIQGRNLHENDLPPHVLVFDDNTTLKVLPKYCELIAGYVDAGKLPKDREYPIKAIAWRKGEDGKFGLKSYWPEYETFASKSKTEYPNFISYLIYAQKEYLQNNGFENIYKGILNAFLKVLRLEQIKNPDSKTGHFTVGSIQKYLKENHLDFYERFRIQLFQWCRDICLGRINDAIPAIKNFIPQLLGCFGKSIGESLDFINDGNTLAICSDWHR